MPSVYVGVPEDARIRAVSEMNLDARLVAQTRKVSAREHGNFRRRLEHPVVQLPRRDPVEVLLLVEGDASWVDQLIVVGVKCSRRGKVDRHQCMEASRLDVAQSFRIVVVMSHGRQYLAKPHTLSSAQPRAQRHGRPERAQRLLVRGRARVRPSVGHHVRGRMCDTMSAMFDAEKSTKALQEAVRVRDRKYLESVISDRMIFVEPVLNRRRGKHEWIEASCSVTWNWFQVDVGRQVDLGDTRVVELWVSLSREAVAGESVASPVTGAGPILDVWANEKGTWRLVARQAQRAGD
jgi:hypothetical protein